VWDFLTGGCTPGQLGNSNQTCVIGTLENGEYVFNGTYSVPFTLYGPNPTVNVGVTLFAQGEEGGIADFIDPGSLDIYLPNGVGVTSELGLRFGSPSTQVPEPSTLWLVIAGLFPLGGIIMRGRSGYSLSVP
jgi:hypothetical protein